MLFESKFAAFRVNVRKELLKRHPVTGDVIETVPAVAAEFGKLGPVYTFTNPETGETMQGAEITGHFYDTDVEAVQQGWTPESGIKEMVERRLLALCQTWPEAIWHVAREAKKAELPWPTYDELDVEDVVKVAAMTGRVAEALAYERENRQRPAAIEAFEDLLGPQEQASEDAVPVAVEEASPVVGNPSLRTISV